MLTRYQSGTGVLLAFVLVAASVGQQAAHSAAAPKFRISGVVVNSLTGQALDKADVTIGPAQGSNAVQAVITGDDGRFEFNGLEAEKFWLRAERRGFALQAFEEHEGFFTGIVTGHGFDTEHLIFKLRPDAGIGGTILDEGDEPVRNAQVTLFRRTTQNGRLNTAQQAQSTTSDEGRYHFSHLLPGTYFVLVEAQPWYSQEAQGTVTFVEGGQDKVVFTEGEPNPAREETRSALELAYPIAFYSGATEPAAATPIALSSGEQVTADLRLNAVPAPRLKLHHPDMRPSEAWNANLTQRGFDNQEIPVQTQMAGLRDGEMEIRGMPPGDYEVTVQTYGKNPRSWKQSASIRGDTDIAVGEEEPSATIGVRGIVRMEGGGPVPNGYVQLWNRITGERMGNPISEKGEFEIPPQPVTAGSYEVTVNGIQDALVSSVSAKGAKVAGENVVIGGAGAVELTITLQRGLAQVDGVALQDGKPAPGAMVILVPRDPENQVSLFRRDQSDQDGTFTLRAVLPGKYTVVAIRDVWDQDWMNPELLARAVQGGTTLEVSPRQKCQVKVNIQDGATVASTGTN